LDARIFKKEEGIPMFEEVGWKLVELHGVVGTRKQGKEQQSGLWLNWHHH